MINMKYKYAIIGSGTAGLGAAYSLKELGESDFVILEKTNRIGGLSASFVDEYGLTWYFGLSSPIASFQKGIRHLPGRHVYLPGTALIPG